MTFRNCWILFAVLKGFTLFNKFITYFIKVIISHYNMFNSVCCKVTSWNIFNVLDTVLSFTKWGGGIKPGLYTRQNYRSYFLCSKHLETTVTDPGAWPGSLQPCTVPTFWKSYFANHSSWKTWQHYIHRNLLDSKRISSYLRWSPSPCWYPHIQTLCADSEHSRK